MLSQNVNILYHKCHSQKFAHEGYVALSGALDRYPRNQGYSCSFQPLVKSHVSDFCVQLQRSHVSLKLLVLVCSAEGWIKCMYYLIKSTDKTLPNLWK